METYSVIFSSGPVVTTRKNDAIGFQKNDARVPPEAQFNWTSRIVETSSVNLWISTLEIHKLLAE